MYAISDLQDCPEAVELVAAIAALQLTDEPAQTAAKRLARFDKTRGAGLATVRNAYEQLAKTYSG